MLHKISQLTQKLRFKMHDFSEQLLKWYQRNKRDLPWRGMKNPYKIWLSEIILQQTRVEQGWKYYLAFSDAYPTVSDLAQASEQEVLKLWQGLGYYSRARNLHFTAQYITNELQGQFPTKYKDLLKLKGVGKYTAAAIASFAYGEAVPAIDGNVYRVLSRVFGEYEVINTPKAEKLFEKYATQLLPEQKAGDFNQATMELGAIICKPKNPNCKECPVEAKCWANAKGKQLELPVKKVAIKVKNRHFNYFVIEQNEAIILQKRTEKDVWQHLYEFPLLEGENVTINSCFEFLNQRFRMQRPVLQRINARPIVHKLSHQHLHITFWKVSGEFFTNHDYSLVVKTDFPLYPMPIVLANFLKKFNKEKALL